MESEIFSYYVDKCRRYDSAVRWFKAYTDLLIKYERKEFLSSNDVNRLKSIRKRGNKALERLFDLV